MSVVEEPPRRTFMQRLLDSTGITKAVANSMKQQMSVGYFAPGLPPSPQGPKDFRPRQEDYRVGYNLNIQPRTDEPISFYDLFMLAENDNITRLLIETRKDQIAALKWSIKPSEIENDSEITPDQAVRMEASQKFFQSPDGEHTFADWLRMLLEDVLVFDAPCVYVNEDDPLQTKFQVVSGMTITRKVDIDGRTPQPPETAYQQIVHGTAAGDFTTDEMIYMPRNLRPNRIYGMSPVQQIVLTVNLALRKQLCQLYYFTDGTIPDALISVPENWTPKQISDFQNAWDDILTGNQAQKRHAKFVPGGTNITMTKEAVLTDDTDLWYTKIRCYAFSVPPTAFEARTNRATAQTSKQAGSEEGLAPLMNWVKQFVDICLQKHLGQYDLEFRWVEDDVLDPVDQVPVLDSQLRSGALTLNEYRKQMGREPYGVEGDVPMVYTATGPIKLMDIINPPAPPPQLQPGGNGGGGGGKPGGGDQDGQEDGKQPGNNGPKGGDQNDSQGGGQNGGKKPPPNGQQAQVKPPPRKTNEEAATEALPTNKGRYGRSQALLKDAGKTLYVSRPLLNAQDVIDWAASQGFPQTLAPEDMHVTVAFSKSPVDWDMQGAASGKVQVGQSPGRSVEQLGDKGAVVLRFTSLNLQNRWQQLCDGGCSWDYPGYKPHVTITYNGEGIDLDSIEPYDGKLLFGPEVWAEVVTDWEKNIAEAPPQQSDDDAGVSKAAAVPFVDTTSAPDGNANSVIKAHKRATLGAGKTRIAPSRHPDKQTKETRESIDGIQEAVMEVFKTMAADISEKVRNYKPALQKASGSEDPDDEDPDIDGEALAEFITVDISQLDALATDDLPTHLSKVYSTAGLTTVGLVGASAEKGIVNLINTRALSFAQSRAAELVGKKWVDGELVDNPDAQWAIDDTTRMMLQQTIYDGLDNGLGVDGLADAIAAMPTSENDMGAFTPFRARMIARTETLNAHGKGDMEGLKAAKANGVHVMKEWYADAEACDICLENMDAGPIELDEEFPSGDMEPTAHPCCECSLNGVTDDGEEDDSVEAGIFSFNLSAISSQSVAKLFRENAARLIPSLRKYNPNQERDEHGRWTSDGGGVVGYHGASSKILASVRRNGLKPGSDKHVWLANNEGTAAMFGAFKGGSAVVFEVHIPKSEMDNFKTLKQTRTVETGALDHAIPPSWIKGYHEVSDVKGANGKIKQELGPLKSLQKTSDAGYVTVYVALLQSYDPDKEETTKGLRKYNEDQPRDDHGKWTSDGESWEEGNSEEGEAWHTTPDRSGGQSNTGELKNAWVAKSPFGDATVQEVQAQARIDQAGLAKVGAAIEQATGAKFINPGIKENSARIEEKLQGGLRTLPEITDIARASFLVDKPSDSAPVLAALREHYNVLDEGFRMYPGDYMDKKLLVQFDSGLIGEVQVLPKPMFDAKMGDGHKLYEAARSLPASDPRVPGIVAQMKQVYSEAWDKVDPSWKAVVGKS